MGKIFGGARGSGKTMELVKESHKTGLYILCKDINRVRVVMDVARHLELDIPFPITVDEAGRPGSRISNVLVDDIEDVLSKFMGMRVEMASTSMAFVKLPREETFPIKNLTFGQAIEYLKQGRRVKRKDWGGYWFMPRHTTYVRDSDIGDRPINTTIFASLKDGGGYTVASPYQSDILAEDWEVA